MKKLITGIVLAFCFTSCFALAADPGPEGYLPSAPLQYSCDEYRSEVKVDAPAANKKAISIVKKSFDYVADVAAYRFYQSELKAKRPYYVLANTLYMHRFTLKKNKLLGEIISSAGNTEYFLGMCKSMKNNQINQIAYALLLAYDTSEDAKNIVNNDD